MNKDLILDILMQKIEKNKEEYTEEDLSLIRDIQDAIIEIQVARSMFDVVSESKLIDLAIHTENVAKARYDYLINIAKARKLKIKITELIV